MGPRRRERAGTRQRLVIGINAVLWAIVAILGLVLGGSDIWT